MHELAPAIISIGLLVFLAHAFVAVFKRTRVPDVLWLILIGVAAGPLLGIVSPEDFGKTGQVFTTIALVVILFEGGLDIHISELRSSWKNTLVVTTLTYVFGWVLLAGLAYIFLPLAFQQSLYIGAVLAGPAPSVIIPLARLMNISEKTRTTLTLESPLGEAVSIIVALAILQSFEIPEFQVGQFLGGMIAAFIFAMLLGAASGFGWSLLLTRVRQLRNAIFLTPSAVFVVYGVAEFLGYSGPIAALAFGVILGNAESFTVPWLTGKTGLEPVGNSDTEKAFFAEVAFLVKTFFFVFLGISIQFSELISFSVSLILVGGLLLSRYGSIKLISRGGDMKRDEVMQMSVLIPKGTAAAVLASLPIQMGLAGGGEIRDVVYGVVFLSIVATAVLIYLVEKTPSLDPTDD
jgi:NhaP-type Na+/H+ or K+/H+ antiporter